MKFLAYERLKGCEYDRSSSGEALHHLHSLIYSWKFGTYKSLDERFMHSRRLACKAALRGFAVSVCLLGSYYDKGEKSLGIVPNKK